MSNRLKGSSCDLLPSFLARLQELLGNDSLKEPWIVAFSGGADSLALCHLLKDAQKDTTGKKLVPEQVVALHVNHKLRGRESDEDEW